MSLSSDAIVSDPEQALATGATARNNMTCSSPAVEIMCVKLQPPPCLRNIQSQSSAKPARKKQKVSPKRSWPFDVTKSQQEMICGNGIPQIIMLGPTGSGKSTGLNRMTTPMDQKREHSFPEGDSALAGTLATQGRILGWMGELEKRPGVFLDTRGFDSLEGDDEVIRESCKFLSDLPHAFIHQFVLVVDASNPRLSKTSEQIIRTFKIIFDPEGVNGFVHYLTVMFTKFPYGDLVDEGVEEFRKLVGKRQIAIRESWTNQLAKILEISDQFELNSLSDRFMFVNNTLPPTTMLKLKNEFGLDLSRSVEDIYERAILALQNPFAIEINPNFLTSPGVSRIVVFHMLAQDFVITAKADTLREYGEAKRDAHTLRHEMAQHLKCAQRTFLSMHKHELQSLSRAVGKYYTELVRKHCAKIARTVEQIHDDRRRDEALKVNEALAKHVMEKCTSDVNACESRAESLVPSERFTAYHDFYAGNEYVADFTKDIVAPFSTATNLFGKVRRHVEREQERLKCALLGPDFVKALSQQSPISARKCPFCNIAWERESGCDNVRCGHLTFTGEELQVVPPSCRLGCGKRFDYKSALAVDEDEIQRFLEPVSGWRVPEQRQVEAPSDPDSGACECRSDEQWICSFGDSSLSLENMTFKDDIVLKEEDGIAPEDSLSNAPEDEAVALPVDTILDTDSIISDAASTTWISAPQEPVGDDGEKKNRCFVPKTFFKSADSSWIEVSELAKGAHVLASSGEKLEVSHAAKTKQDLQQLVEIVTWQNRLMVTESHRLVVETDGSVCEVIAKDLRKGMLVSCPGGATEVLEVRRFQQETEVFDIAFVPDKPVECLLLDLPGILTKGSVPLKRQTRRGGMKKRVATFPDTDEELTFGEPSQMEM